MPAGFHEASAEIVGQFVTKLFGVVGRNKYSRQQKSWCLTEVAMLVLKCAGASGCSLQEILGGLWGLSVSLPDQNLVSGNLRKALFWLKETLRYLQLAPS